MTILIACAAVLAIKAEAVRAVSAAGQPEPVALERELQSELAGREFLTKMAIATRSDLRVQGMIVVGQGATALVVDTEIEPSGTVRYLVPSRQPGMLLGGSFHIEATQVSGWLAPGSRVMVVGVEVMDNRVELQLRGPQGERGKLKFMIGRDFRRRWAFDDVLGFVGRALKIERVERAAAVPGQYEALLKEVKRLEAALTSRERATEKLEDTRELLKVLEDLVRNRDELARVTRQPAGAERDQYQRRISELTQAIPLLEREAREERVAALKASLAAAAQDAERLRAAIGSQAPTSFAEWNARLQAVEGWEASVSRRVELLERLEAEGEKDSAARAAIAREREELAGVRESMTRDRARVELAELDREFRELDRERVRLLDAYTRAFGSPGQAAAAERLLTHLRRMRDNRAAAEAKGSPTASEQIARIEAEMRRVRRQ
jgi:hypothetical protein